MYHDNPLYQKICQNLEDKKKLSLLRRTAPWQPDTALDLSSNSYLNLHANQELHARALSLIQQQTAGNLASRLIATASPLYEQLETELAEWKSCESALLFNSGYAANVGIVQALAGRDTHIFSDKLNHASIVDGIRLSGATLQRYHHVDCTHLEQLLKKSCAREKLIITDTVFSMDGDRAPLRDICTLAERYNALLMVDEAHAAGMLGATASGLVEELGVEKQVAIRVGTLSKALAGLGGFFAGDSALREYLVNNARSLIYSTALPHSVLAFNLTALRHVRAHPQEGAALIKRAQRFAAMLQDGGFDTLGSSTQIVPCLTHSEERALQLSQLLREQAIKVAAIRPPTVPAGSARLRFSIHTGVEDGALEQIVAILTQWRKNHD
jgi:8-amino-7-oxononanoate synthase